MTASVSSLTVAELAQAKRLPLEFLLQLGLRDTERGVAIPYRAADGGVMFERLRLSLDGPKRFLQPAGVSLAPYGLDRLGVARERGFLVFDEGESDSWTLWHGNFPALGLPGAGTGRTLAPEHLAGIDRFFALREPGPSGEAFVNGIARRLREIGFTGEAFEINCGDLKDPSELYTDDPARFRERFNAILNHAQALNLEIDQPTTLRDSAALNFRTVARYLEEAGRVGDSKWCVESTLRAGELSIWAGRAYAGKSTTAAALTRSLTNGEAFLGRACLVSRVGYMALERNGRTVAQLLDSWGLAAQVHFCDEAPPDNLERLAESLEAQIVENRLDVIIVDHLQNLIRVRDTKDYAEVSRALELLGRVAKRTGAHIMLLHHQPKVEREGVIDVMGSEAYRAAVDALFEIRVRDGQRYIRGEIRGMPDLPRHRITIDLETGDITAVDDNDADRQTALTKIKIFLDTQTEPVTFKPIQKAVEMNRELILSVLTQAVNEGEISRTGKGVKGDPHLFSLPGKFDSHTEIKASGTGSVVPLKIDSDRELFGSHNSDYVAGIAFPPEPFEEF